jgi:peptidoglycan/xylan/chitin deacetylase (PgdA/CDA1 family)
MPPTTKVRTADADPSWCTARHRGRQDALRYLTGQGAIRELRLSRYSQVRLRWRVVRALLLRLRLPPRVVAAVAVLPRSFAAAAAVPSPTARARAEIAADYAYWFGARGALAAGDHWARVRGSGVPILMYHRIVSEADPADPKYAMTWRRFTAQMRLLRLLGYRTLPLGELVRRHRAGELPPPHSVVVTFDDGSQDNERAARYMLAHGQTGTIFLVTGCLGGERTWSTVGLPRIPMLTWGQVRDLRSAGFEFGSHTHTHPDLSRTDSETAAGEIRTARAHLARELGDVDHLFAYPYGGHNATTKALVAASGYAAACGVRRGLSDMHDDLFCLRRVAAYGDENLGKFAMRLMLGESLFDYLPWDRARRWLGRTRS